VVFFVVFMGFSPSCVVETWALLVFVEWALVTSVSVLVSVSFGPLLDTAARTGLP
jgi:hypothetical protein